MFKHFKEKFIGDKEFYKIVLMVATPKLDPAKPARRIGFQPNDSSDD